VVRRAAQEDEVEAGRGRLSYSHGGMRALLPLRPAPTLLALLLAGCPSTTVRVLPEPIPVEIGGGALMGAGSVDEGAAFPPIIHSGSPVTAWNDGSSDSHAHVGTFRVLSVDESGAPGVPRIQIDNLRFYTAPLGPVGVGAGVPVGGVFGGDQLQRWAVGLDY